MNEKNVTVREFFVRDYGAVGDGVTDDSLCIGRAVDEAAAFTAATPGARAVVRFAPDTTYYVYALSGEPCEDEGCLVRSPKSDLCIHLIHARGVTLRGQNTILIGEPDKLFLYIASCEDIVIEGLHFTYRVPIGVTATVVRQADNVIDLETPFPLEYEGDVYHKDFFLFALPANGRRDHAFYQDMERIAPRVYRIPFASGGYPLMKVGTKVYLPVPEYGHRMVGFAIIGCCGSITMRNCLIDEIGSFVFSINGNDGRITFDRVRVQPKDPLFCPISSWRDCIHAKDNRGGLTFVGCDFSGNEDDVLNMSNTMLEVTDVAADGTVTAWGMNYDNGAFHRIYPGDTVTAIDFVSGKLYGTTKVKDVLSPEPGKIRLALVDDLGLAAGSTRLSIEEFACPHSLIRGCRFSGTVRIRGSAVVENTDFDLLQMWTAYENICEGPIPKDITYRNCRFTRKDKTSTGAMITFADQCDSGCTPEYAVRDIVFDHCRFDDSAMLRLPDGGGVRLEECTFDDDRPTAG